jgi:hypothetical protein
MSEYVSAMERLQMNLIGLVIFLLICFGLGFLGHLVSPRYGWPLGAGLAVPVFILMLVGSFKESCQNYKNRPR